MTPPKRRGVSYIFALLLLIKLFSKSALIIVYTRVQVERVYKSNPIFEAKNTTFLAKVWFFSFHQLNKINRWSLPTLNHLRFRPGRLKIPHFLKERSTISLERLLPRLLNPLTNCYERYCSELATRCECPFPHSSSKSSIFPVNDPWMACLNRHPEVGRGLSGHRV